MRKDPAGLWIRRWYCPTAHQTVSLLPDFAAAHLPGTLQEVEEAVATFEHHRSRGSSVAEAAQLLRPDIELQGALRWISQRRRWALAALTLLVGCVPELLMQVELSVLHVRTALGCTPLLVAVREIAAVHLNHASSPVGLAPRSILGNQAAKSLQHSAGPDPPPPSR